ncbi:hypothetical protein TYRP_013625 [Tyrophagus putrescentiae]|nr:hypothetical protein TYRP_013625 [Tyrophagus putrescentiae]
MSRIKTGALFHLFITGGTAEDRSCESKVGEQPKDESVADNETKVDEQINVSQLKTTEDDRLVDL